ncbi:Multisubstrate adapter protein soc-1 [Bienertia sinuspersici]
MWKWWIEHYYLLSC